MRSKTDERRWMQQWNAAREALREQRARELAALSEEDALAAADALLTIEAVVELPPAPSRTSGLVQQQALFHRKNLP